jgi:hypothetical protein
MDLYGFFPADSYTTVLFSIEEWDHTLPGKQFVSFRKKDAKIGIGKVDVCLTLLWLRTSLFLDQV